MEWEAILGLSGADESRLGVFLAWSFLLNEPNSSTLFSLSATSPPAAEARLPFQTISSERPFFFYQTFPTLVSDGDGVIDTETFTALA